MARYIECRNISYGTLHFRTLNMTVQGGTGFVVPEWCIEDRELQGAIHRGMVQICGDKTLNLPTPQVVKKDPPKPTRKLTRFSDFLDDLQDL